MTATDTSLEQLASALVAAADVVAQLVPTAEPLAVGDVTANGDVLIPGPNARALVAPLGDGTIALALSPELGYALEDGPLGPQALDAVLQPILAEAVKAIAGPDAELGAAQMLDTELIVEAAADAQAIIAVDLLDGGNQAAALVYTVMAPAQPEAAAPVPATTDAVASAAPASFEPLTSNAPSRISAAGLDLLHDVEMGVTAELGRTRMAVRDLLGLAPGSVVELDRLAGGPVDLLVNGTLIARGEVVVIDEEFGVRITEIVSNEQGRSR